MTVTFLLLTRDYSFLKKKLPCIIAKTPTITNIHKYSLCFTVEKTLLISCSIGMIT